MKKTCFFLCLTILLLAGCKDSTQWSEFDDYQYTTNLDIHFFPHNTAKQIYFTTDAVYPNTDVLNFYISNIKQPWVLCEGNNEWSSFKDFSGEKPLSIHQVMRYWVNRKDSRLLMLAIKYYSAASKHNSKPDNHRQEIYLVEYKEPSLNKAISLLELNCNGE